MASRSCGVVVGLISSLSGAGLLLVGSDVDEAAVTVVGSDEVSDANILAVVFNEGPLEIADAPEDDAIASDIGDETVGDG